MITVNLPDELARLLLDRRPSAIHDSSHGWATFQAQLRAAMVGAGAVTPRTAGAYPFTPPSEAPRNAAGL